jgi:hypothetical protein
MDDYNVCTWIESSLWKLGCRPFQDDQLDLNKHMLGNGDQRQHVIIAGNYVCLTCGLQDSMPIMDLYNESDPSANNLSPFANSLPGFWLPDILYQNF